MNMGKRLGLGILWVVVGAALIVLSLIGTLDSSVYASMGGMLAGIGIMRVVQALRYEHDPAYRETCDIQALDERNRFLRTQSWAWTGYIVVIVEGVGAIIALALGNQVAQMVLACSVSLIVATYWVTYQILCKRY